LSRKQAVSFVALLLVCAAQSALSQFKTEIVNSQGAAAPCVGIGPVGAPAAKKCVELFLDAGFLREDDAGATGLTVGTTGNEDGVVVKVEPGSVADQAGLAAGDRIVAVDGKPADRTPGELARMQSFGKKGDTLHMTVRRNGAEVEVAFARGAGTAPPGPRAGGFMVMVKPLINWQGQFVPCIGIGPAAAAAIEFCNHKFEPYGYIKVGELGSAGFQVDTARKEKAVITGVDAGSAAAAAGLQAGDEILRIEGKPLTPSPGETVNEYLFGKTGDQRKVTVRKGKEEKTVTLTLATPAKK